MEKAIHDISSIIPFVIDYSTIARYLWKFIDQNAVPG